MSGTSVMMHINLSHKSKANFGISQNEVGIGSHMLDITGDTDLTVFMDIDQVQTLSDTLVLYLAADRKREAEEAAKEEAESDALELETTTPKDTCELNDEERIALIGS